MTSSNPVDFYAVVAVAVENCSLSLGEGEAPADTDQMMKTSFEDLGFDSLNMMEFCIAVSLETGVDLNVGQVSGLRTPMGVVQHLEHQG